MKTYVSDINTITIPFIFRIKSHANQSYPSIDKNCDRLIDIFNNGHISIRLDIRSHLKLENCVYGYEYNYNLFYLSNQESHESKCPPRNKNRNQLTDIFNKGHGHISIQLDIRSHLKLENVRLGYKYNYNPFYFSNQESHEPKCPPRDKNRDRLIDIFNNGHICIRLDIRSHLKLENCAYESRIRVQLQFLPFESKVTQTKESCDRSR